jgi:MinD-like ATPase involved in chromosome partitioning or flagellar assembly
VTQEDSTVAVVGACGGAGATRLTVETAATLARAGRHVAVVDVATATQGLAGCVPGRIDPDLTAVLLADDPSLDAALVPLDLDVPGSVAAAPVRAPFERFARAQTAGAARTLSEQLGAVAGRFDHVLVDAPPVATNLAVAATTAADRVAVVAPPGERGADAVQRTRGRLADVGAPAPVVVVNEGAAGGPTGAVADAADHVDGDVTIPASDVCARSRAPAVVDPDETFAPAVAAVTELATGADLDLSFPESGVLADVL